jgi:FAD-dependent oxidoreductase domain-containing protein 1
MKVFIKAIDLGVKYLDGEVVDANMTTTTSSISSQNISVITEGNVKSLIIRNIRTKEVTSLSTEYIVSAAGAWSNSLLSAITQSQPNMKVFNLPIRPKKRCIFIVQCPVTSVEFLSSSSSSSTSVPPLTTPLVIDPSGVYFRPEGVKGRFITGVSPLPEDDPDCEGQAEELENVDNKQFEDIIWPALYERVPAFEKLKVIGSWAGFYDYNTFDQVR